MVKVSGICLVWTWIKPSKLGKLDFSWLPVKLETGEDAVTELLTQALSVGVMMPDMAPPPQVQSSQKRIVMDILLEQRNYKH